MRRSPLTFLLFAAGTFAVWIVAAMSDDGEYPCRYRLQYTGYDTLRYVLTSADTVLNTTETSNGFHAFRRHHGRAGEDTLFIDISHSSGDTIILDDAALHSLLDSVLLSSRVRSVSFAGTPLHISKAPRSWRKVPVRVRGISWGFTSQYGLGGDPQLVPDSITLYGSEASLSQISEVTTASVTVAGISRSESVTVPLNPSWLQYKDVKASQWQVDINVPVARLVERKIKVKVLIDDDLSAISDSIRLYPEYVDAVCWVRAEQYRSLSAGDIAVVASPADDGSGKLRVHVDRFPAGVRVKSLSPQEIEYVIITK